MPTPELTIDEIVSSIQKSQLISVVIEGKDDVVAFRTLERDLNQEFKNNITLVPAGGRSKVLQILDQIKGSKALDRCIFICDKDIWVFSGVPDEISAAGVITTEGYSIENDIIRDYPPTDFMDDSEIIQYDSEVNYFSQWFAEQVKFALDGKENNLSLFPGVILDKKPRDDFGYVCDPDHQCASLFQMITAENRKYIRGKSLLQVAMRQLSRKGRASKHHHLSFLEHGSVRRGKWFSRIISEVNSRVQAMDGR
jgi:hypothetical protein